MLLHPWMWAVDVGRWSSGAWNGLSGAPTDRRLSVEEEGLTLFEARRPTAHGHSATPSPNRVRRIVSLTGDKHGDGVYPPTVTRQATPVIDLLPRGCVV